MYALESAEEYTEQVLMFDCPYVDRAFVLFGRFLPLLTNRRRVGSLEIRQGYGCSILVVHASSRAFNYNPPVAHDNFLFCGLNNCCSACGVVTSGSTLIARRRGGVGSFGGVRISVVCNISMGERFWLMSSEVIGRIVETAENFKIPKFSEFH